MHEHTAADHILVIAFAGLVLFGSGTKADDPTAIHPMPELKRLTTDGQLKQRPVWSPDGQQLLFARHGLDTIQLFVLDTETGDEKRLTDRRDPEYDGVYSPDGKQIAFSYDKTSPNQGDIEVYRMQIQSQQLTPIATGGGKLSHEEWPSWSPSGDRVAFTSTREGNQELFVTRIDGGDWTRLSSQPGIDAHPAWSPDGKTIAFSTDRWGDLEIALIDPDGTNLRRLTYAHGLDDYPAWSADGQRLAWTTNRSGNMEACIYDWASRKTVIITAPDTIENFPSWSPNGHLTFVSDRDGAFDIYSTVEPLR